MTKPTLLPFSDTLQPIHKRLESIVEAINSGIRHAFETIQLGPAVISLNYSLSRVIHLTSFIVKPQERRKGYGAKLLRILISWADEHKLTLQLFASPADKGLSIKALVDLYKKRGFYLIHKTVILRDSSDMIAMKRDPKYRPLSLYR